MNKISIQYLKSPYGELILGSYDGQLCLADWRYRKMRSANDVRIKKGLEADFQEEESEVIELAISQFMEYFSGKRKIFEIPLLLIGTKFQKSVWEELQKIPFGKTESYLGLSKQLGNELAIRAVASANGANTIAIIVPCHRIIGSNGELVGYAGGLAAKKKLLQLEGIGGNQLELF